MTQAQAPGKVIVSGEHAVVYGRPALVVAVDRYVRTEIAAIPGDSVEIEFVADRQAERWRFAWKELFTLYDRLTARYERFVAGHLPITAVLERPFDLIPFALTSTFVQEKRASPQGIKARIVSELPLGCGMGSSASVALSALQAVAGFLGVAMDRERLFARACECERLRHGITSGLDPYVCLHGGFIKFHGNARTPCSFPNPPFHWVMSGVPESSTGACVMAVRERFAGSAIWDEFAAVTEAVETALKASERPIPISTDTLALGGLARDESGIRAADAARDRGPADIAPLLQALRRNHALLTILGVVPLKAQQFIADVEKRGGAAKISGAGAVKGANAGAILVCTPSGEPPLELCQQYDYQLLSISSDHRGTHLL